MEETVENKRLYWIDFYKTICIFLIVFGHCLGGRTILYNYVYAFHVPAFFLISGLTFRRKTNYFVFLKNKIVRLLIPYLIAGLISILIFFVLGSFASESLDVSIKTTDIGKNILGMLYGNGATGLMKWNLPLWFIPCLFMLLNIMYFIDFLLTLIPLNNMLLKFVLTIISIIISCVVYLNVQIPPLFFGLDLCIYYLPFIIFGSLLNDLLKCKFGKLKFISIISAIIFIIFSIIYFVIPQSVEYVHHELGNIYIFYIFSFILSVSLLLTCKVFNNNNIFSRIGRTTLFILLFHKFPIIIFQILFKKFLTNDVIFLISSTLVSLLIVLLFYWVDTLLVKIFQLIKRKIVHRI